MKRVRSGHETAVPQPGADDGDAHAADVGFVRAVRQGDAEAFAPLVDRYAPRLHALLRRFFRDLHDVDDLLQESLVRAYQSLDRYDASRPFYPWLRKITVNLALSEIERRRRRREIDEGSVVLEQMASVARSDRAAQDREIIEAVQVALEDLPPAWSAVFRLRTFEDMSYAEIAEALDQPIGTVMSQLARARSRIAEALAARFGPRRQP